MKFYKLLVLFLLCVMLVGCGPSAEKITILSSRYQEAIGLYDSMAPIVAKLDDQSVESYEKAGKSVRKAKRAVESNFSEYNNSEMDELLADLENAMLILRTFEGREPVKPILKEENGKVFSVKFTNHSGITFKSLVLKSGSGNNDVKIDFNAGLAPDAYVTENIQAPESESFSVSGISDGGGETSFAGNFYLSTVSDVTLTNDEGKYIITTEYTE